jgi:hypothetical protein
MDLQWANILLKILYIIQLKKNNNPKHIKANKKQLSLRKLVLKIDVKLDNVITLTSF